MANSSQFLTSPQPLSLLDGYNSFVSNWADKRSAPNFGLSVVFYYDTVDGYTPDGYAWLETSNAPAQTGTSYGQPYNNGDDAAEVPNSQQNIALNPVSNTWMAQWQVSGNGAHYVRVRYTANTNKHGLSVNVYFNGAFSST